MSNEMCRGWEDRLTCGEDGLDSLSVQIRGRKFFSGFTAIIIITGTPVKIGRMIFRPIRLNL